MIRGYTVLNKYAREKMGEFYERDFRNLLILWCDNRSRTCDLRITKTQRIISEGGWVFESLSKPGFPVTGDAITRALERLRTKYMAEIAPFSPHDLRRSVATGCAEYLDAPERLIELLLNHVPKDRLIRTYQVGQQAEKLRNLFLKWGNFIEYEIIQSNNNAPDNVVKISFGRK